MKLTADVLRERLQYDPDTGVFTWLRPGSNRTAPGAEAGTISVGGYRIITINKKLYRAHRLAWLYMQREWPASDVDHIDRDPLNNRWANLRLATTSQNIANSSLRSDNTSGVRGVYYCSRRKRWIAMIRVQGRNKFIGRFLDLEKAAEARRKAATQHFGEFANTDQ